MRSRPSASVPDDDGARRRRRERHVVAAHLGDPRRVARREVDACRHPLPGDRTERVPGIERARAGVVWRRGRRRGSRVAANAANAAAAAAARARAGRARARRAVSSMKRRVTSARPHLGAVEQRAAETRGCAAGRGSRSSRSACAHPRERLLARVAVSDELREQRIVVDGDRLTRDDAGVHANARRPTARDTAGAGPTAAAASRVLGIDAALDRVAARRDVVPARRAAARPRRRAAARARGRGR